MKKIAKALKNRNLTDVTVSSIEMYQGKEKPIILVSTVRSGPIGIGFLRNEKVRAYIYLHAYLLLAV